jgi:hypothetical protein
MLDRPPEPHRGKVEVVVCVNYGSKLVGGRRETCHQYKVLPYVGFYVVTSCDDVSTIG